MTAPVKDWVPRLTRLAEAALAVDLADAARDPPAYIDRFRDEFGHRRPEDAPFLAAHLGLPWRAPGRPRSSSAMLWALAASPPHVPDAPDTRSDDIAAVLGPADASGPLLYHTSGPIEAATDRELSAIHALWRLSERAPAWRSRALAAAGWCCQNLQPDNATNEPWAIHVFLALSDAHNLPDAGLYAQNLLQNALVGAMTGGTLTRRSAWIVRDAAQTLARYLDRP